LIQPSPLSTRFDGRDLMASEVRDVPSGAPSPRSAADAGYLHEALQEHRQLLLQQLNDWACAEQEMLLGFIGEHCKCDARGSGAFLGSAAKRPEVTTCDSETTSQASPPPAEVCKSAQLSEGGNGYKWQPLGLDIGEEVRVPGGRRSSIGATSMDLFHATDTYDSEDMRWEQAAYLESVRASETGSPGEATRRPRPRCCGIDTASTPFEVFFSGLIVCNSISIGLEIEYTISSGSGAAPFFFLILNPIFTVLFVFELLLRVGTERCGFFRSRQWAWNLFDAVVVTCAVAESIFELLHYTSRMGLGNLRIVRFVRLVRILRVLRIPRIIRYVNALYHLVCSLGCTMKSLIWAFVLLTMILYLFGIVFTHAVFDHLSIPGNVDGDGTMREYWGSLGTSMFTLFLCITDGLSWRIAIKPLGEIHKFWVGLFTVFYSFIFFAVLNIVTAAFVQSAIEGAARDLDMITMSMRAKEDAHYQAVQTLFSVLDPCETGYITLDQLNSNIENDSVKAYLALLELSTGNAWKLFKLLDVDGDHKISLGEFVDGSLRLSGNAKSMDVVAILQYEHKWLRKKLCAQQAVTFTQAVTPPKGLPKEVVWV